MINQIKDFTYKSWNKYTGPSDCFGQKNIFFGYNGKGKSALAHGLLQEIKNIESNNDGNFYRLFDKNYVKDNLLLKDNDKIHGITANFGKKNIDIEKRITAKESEKQDTSVIERKLAENENKIRNEIDHISKSKKQESSIKKKHADDLETLLKRYDQDLNSARKLVDSDEELRDIQSEAQFDEELETVRSIQTPKFPFPTEEEIKNLYDIMSNSYSDDMVPTTTVVEWIKQGLAIHQEGHETTCQFCGGPLNLDEVQSKLSTYLNNRKQQDEAELNSLYKNLEVIVNYKNDGLDKDKILFTEMANDTTEAIFDDIKICLDIIGEICSEIKEKLSNFNIGHEINAGQIEQQIEQINHDIDKLKSIKKDRESKLQENVNKYNTLIKGSIALEIKNSSLINDSYTSLKRAREELNIAIQKNSELDHEITELRNSKSTTSDFATFLNEVLVDLDMGFSLEVDEKDYVIRNTKDNKLLTVNDISEGESNLLALLIFYYELFDDEYQKNFKSCIKYIIIDDPISSIDNINRIYILELLKNILDCKNPQIFIFTHDWEDFIDLCYGRDNRGETLYEFYEVMKDSNGSYLKKSDHRETPYKHDFKEIYNLSLKDSVADMNDCEIYHYPNIMRKVLEEFMKMKVTNSNPSRNNIHNVEIALCGNVNNVNHEDRLQIPALLDTCNILSHRQRRDPEQVLKSAKYLIKKIQETDPNHYRAMIES